MNREEIDRMIDEMPLLESDWIDDKRKREETYRAILEEGNGRKLAQLIVSIYSQKQDKLKGPKIVVTHGCGNVGTGRRYAS